MPTYIRVRDEDSGREFDVPEGTYLGGLKVVEKYPPNLTGQPRPAKERAQIKRATTPQADTKAADNKE